MSDINEVKQKLDNLVTATIEERAEVQTMLTALRTQVQTLQDQIAAGTVVTQADLDALAAKLDEALADVKAISEPAA